MSASGAKLDRRADYLDLSALFARPFAGTIVRLLRPTRVTPHQVTLAALAAGLAAAWAVGRADRAGFLAGALLLQAKNILDAADGGLARARRTPSWTGRYLDSVMDFAVNVALHAALAAALAARGAPPGVWLLAAGASLSTLAQCSFYVHYTIRYLSLSGRARVSRVSEAEIPRDDPIWRREWSWRLAWLHRAHVLLYGWQDAAVARLDDRLRRRSPAGADARRWYGDRGLLTATSLLGLGCQLAAASAALLADRPRLYLWGVVTAGNLYVLLLCVLRARLRPPEEGTDGLHHETGEVLREPPAPQSRLER